MRARLVVPLLLVVLGASLGLVAAATFVPGEAASLPHRRFVPGLAADSAPTPTPTPTPLPGPGPGAGQLYVAMFVDIEAKELGVTGTGTTVVPISAFVLDVPLPTAQAPTVTAIGTFTIAPHPDDHPDAETVCVWTRSFASDIFGATFFDTGDLSVMARLQAPEWHYTMTCQAPGGSTPPVRFPAFGEESLFLFLNEAMMPYRQSIADPEVRIPMDAVSGGCIKRQKEIVVPASTGDVTLKILVYTKPCLLPI